MDGLEATYRLRQMPAFKNVPLVAASASATNLEAEKCLAVGASAFLPKPIDFNKLLQQLDRLLQLTWIYQQAEGTSLAEGHGTGPLVLPSQEEMDTLYRLALMGNMQNILQRATYLVELDERYRPFADQLSVLARGYQSKAVLSLVQRHMEANQIDSKG
jgi:DNA-binding response OmpR family regulator